VAEALEKLGIDLSVEEVGTEAARGGRRFDAVLTIAGCKVPVEVRSVMRGAEAYAAGDRVGGGGMVVADRISGEARRVLREQGINWLDRRGHLRLKLPTVLIDADVAPLARGVEETVNPWSPLGRDVAVALLLHADEAASPVAVARRIGARGHSRVSVVMGEFRRRNLLDRKGRPLVPELFWELSEAWSPRWQGLATRPEPEPWLRLAGSIGALRNGAPIAVGDNWPLEIYVPDTAALRAVVRLHSAPVTDALPPVARVAVCPSRYAWSLELPGEQEFPVAAQIVVALDLAQDVRGREVLEEWSPGGRVW